MCLLSGDILPLLILLEKRYWVNERKEFFNYASSYPLPAHCFSLTLFNHTDITKQAKTVVTVSQIGIYSGL